MKYSALLGGLFLLSNGGSVSEAASESIIWRLDNLANIAGNRPQILGTPKLVGRAEERAIQFDGKGDALVFDTNPLADLDKFTVEVIFRPDPDGSPEQRFVHLQEVDDHRVLIETRLTPDGHWFLDTFLKSGGPERTLYAKEFLHETGVWFHAALTYDGSRMRHYVNGVQEMEGGVQFRPMTGGQTSVGCRLNRVFWFKGSVRALGFTGRALAPSEFVLR